MTSIGFIGGGRVARILLGGWQHAGRMPERVVVSDPSADSLRELQSRFPGIHAIPGANPDAAYQDIVLLAVHPPVAPAILAEIVPVLQPGTIVVSLMPKVSIARIASMLGGFQRIVRMIPNAASVVGRGYNPIAFSPALSGQERSRIVALLAPLGDCPEVPEEHLEAYAVLTAMGPTYLWFQFDALTKLGVAFGLPASAAAEGVLKMAEGAIATMAGSGLTPAGVMDLVPVKPLGEDEAVIRDCYERRLRGMYAMLKG
ncbi:MAG: NAD(P)-binding domain-containing protein [Methanomicrobiales archaeon]|nr:NAD(P)-binding domain-containing protein [Methanomicrobiales archaeon]MDI6875735.1 NAD(P)-binding domain-containing protein [Methanomicrobiales archaeon]